jgi:hypothetical protein
MKTSISEYVKNHFATSEESQFGGFRAKVVDKNGKIFFLSSISHPTKEEAKSQAEDYLKKYIRKVS